MREIQLGHGITLKVYQSKSGFWNWTTWRGESPVSGGVRYGTADQAETAGRMV